jgi:hypothetical protein
MGSPNGIAMFTSATEQDHRRCGTLDQASMRFGIGKRGSRQYVRGIILSGRS